MSESPGTRESREAAASCPGETRDAGVRARGYLGPARSRPRDPLSRWLARRRMKRLFRVLGVGR
jgi:hypothetical protein